MTQEEKECLYCGSTELKKYKEKEIQYIYCSNCDKKVPLNDYVKRSESDFICDNCGARVLEEDDKCLQCGEPLYEDDEHKEKSSKNIPKTGYNLMCLGATIYFVVSIITFVYTPDYRDIDEVLNYTRLMAALGFMGVFAFMFGSIKQIKELM